jgi:flagellar assembly protein FliH
LANELDEIVGPFERQLIMVLMKAAEFAKKGDNKEIFSLRDVADEARQIIEAARNEYDRLLIEAQTDIQRQLEQAAEKGYQQGYREGLDKGQQEGLQQALTEARQKFAENSAETINALKSVLQYFDQAKENLLWQAEQETVALALAIAEKVVKQTVTKNAHNAEITIANVKAALELVVRNTDVTVMVNPEDLKHLEELAGKTETALGNFTSIKFESDRQIAPGGCKVSTEKGRIDGQLDMQIARIAAELLMTTDEVESQKNDLLTPDVKSGDD